MRNYPWCMSLCVTWLHRIGALWLAVRARVCAYILAQNYEKFDKRAIISLLYYSSVRIFYNK